LERKNPAEEALLPGSKLHVVQLTVAAASGRGNSLAPQGFALFAAFELAGLFIAFFQLQPLEQTVVLNFFLQNAHRLFKVVVQNLDFDIFQLTRPLLSIGPLVSGLVVRRWLFSFDL
jgi:hypothetical protein